jgi:hypothetical protein
MDPDTDLKIDSNAMNNIEQDNLRQNRRLGVIVILVILVVGLGFYGVWGMFLNKGNVVFNGEGPFAVTIGNEEMICLDIECEIDLSARAYTYEVTKDGYYDQSGFVDVMRGETARVDLALKYIPGTLQQAERSTFALPVGYSKFTDRLLDISLFALVDAGEPAIAGEESERAVLQKLPKRPENIVFSESGEKALVFEDKGDGIMVAIYDTEDFSMEDIGVDEASEVRNGVWGASEQTIYFIAHDVVTGKDSLQKICIDSSCEPENLVYFLRNVEDYEIKISPNENFVAILDKTHNLQIVYIIDLVNSTRTNIFEGYLMELGDWSDGGEVVVFKGKNLEGNDNYLRAFDTQDNEIIDLNFNGDIRNTSFYGDSMYFMSTQKHSLHGDNKPYLMMFDDEEVFVSDARELLNMDSEEIKFILGKWDFVKNEMFFVKDLSDALSIIPEKIEVNQDGMIVRILSDDILYDLRIKE